MSQLMAKAGYSSHRFPEAVWRLIDWFEVSVTQKQ